MIRIIIAEDNPIVRAGLIGLIEEQDDLRIVGEAESGVEALKLLETGKDADIILSDLNMPEMDGIALTEAVRSMYPQLKMIILTMHLRPDFVDRTLQAGAQGYILKDGDFDELFEGIRTVYAGNQFVTSGISGR